MSVEEELGLASIDLELSQVLLSWETLIEDIEEQFDSKIEWEDKALLVNYLRWAYLIGKGLADPDEDLTS